MSDELFSLRALVVAASRDECDLFHKGAASTSVPVEVAEADDAASARGMLGGGADLVFLDGKLGSAQIAQVVAAARAKTQPPFTILLAGPEPAAEPFATDALATKPSQLDDARRLIERTIRVRLTNRVLVVDDSSTMRSIVRKILAATRFPFEVTDAAEGFAALKLVSETEFDLVFLDYNMPGFSGLETLAEFKREKRRMSVVVMTSMRDEALAARARELGAAFLQKPFFPADIDAVLCEHYGLRALNPKRA